MVQLCFVLDLRSLAPPLLEDLKQVLRALYILNKLRFPYNLTSILSSVIFFSKFSNIHPITHAISSLFLIDRRFLIVRSCIHFQSLLQLANFYAISSSSSSSRKSTTLCDKIGLCYVVKNRLSSSSEVMFQHLAHFYNFAIRITNLKCTKHICIMIPKSE